MRGTARGGSRSAIAARSVSDGGNAQNGARRISGNVCRAAGRLGMFRAEVNPVTRSNVYPEIDPPTTPSFYAFSYTVPSEAARRAALSLPSMLRPKRIR